MTAPALVAIVSQGGHRTATASARASRGGTAAAGRDSEGAKSIEVAAMLGDSVVDVKHCIDPTTGKIDEEDDGACSSPAPLACSRRRSRSASSVHTAARNKARVRLLDARREPPGRTRSAPRCSAPATTGSRSAGSAFGIFALARGLVAHAATRRRARTTGLAPRPASSMATEHAPAADFALVAPRGDDFVLQRRPRPVRRDDRATASRRSPIRRARLPIP